MLDIEMNRRCIAAATKALTIYKRKQPDRHYDPVRDDARQFSDAYTGAQFALIELFGEPVPTCTKQWMVFGRAEDHGEPDSLHSER